MQVDTQEVVVDDDTIWVVAQPLMTPQQATQQHPPNPCLPWCHRGCMTAMADRRCEWTAAISHVLLCTVALISATRTLQVNRGVAAGFFLQAITSALGAASSFLVPLGLNLESLVQSGAWVSSVIGLPLLAFGFHWLHGDHSTANVTLGSGLLLAAGFDYLTPEGRDMVAHSVTVATLASTLIISILAGNYYGMLGSVMVTLSGLISAMKAERLLVLRKEDALNCILLVGTLAFQKAFRTANFDLV